MNERGFDGPVRIVEVVDGDTVKVSRQGSGAGSSVETLRLIGIDTPETRHPTIPVECFGPEASAKAKELLAGTQVYLEYDASQGRYDRYGRTLAYVWMSDGRMFNEVMIRQGFANEYTYRTAYRHQDLFRRAERSARADARGLWLSCESLAGAPAPAVTPGARCDPNYSGACVPIVTYDLNCADISGRVKVVGRDIHRFDGDGDGYGCE
jgi:micrococcal nuclease